VDVRDYILGRVVRTDERRKEGMGWLFSWCLCVCVFLGEGEGGVEV